MRKDLAAIRARSCASVSPDGKIIATAGDDRTIRLWRLADGTLQGKLSGHTGEVETLAFAPGGKTLASGGRDATIRIWDVATQGQSRSIDRHWAAFSAWRTH